MRKSGRNRLVRSPGPLTYCVGVWVPVTLLNKVIVTKTSRPLALIRMSCARYTSEWPSPFRFVILRTFASRPLNVHYYIRVIAIALHYNTFCFSSRLECQRTATKPEPNRSYDCSGEAEPEELLTIWHPGYALLVNLGMFAPFMRTLFCTHTTEHGAGSDCRTLYQHPFYKRYCILTTPRLGRQNRLLRM
jgi:hypothetical protein